MFIFYNNLLLYKRKLNSGSKKKNYKIFYPNVTSALLITFLILKVKKKKKIVIINQSPSLPPKIHATHKPKPVEVSSVIFSHLTRVPKNPCLDFPRLLLQFHFRTSLTLSLSISQLSLLTLVSSLLLQFDPSLCFASLCQTKPKNPRRS